MNEPATIPFGRPWINDADRQAVASVLDGHILTHGPQCKGFEEDFATFVGDGANAVTVSSAMAALHLAYLHLGVGPGDEVVVPAQTHVATVHAVEWTGARPVFADCDPATGNLTAESIRAAISPRTKAVGVVHFLGIPCNMPEIMKVVADHDLKLVEDCALAIGSRWNGKHVGLFGDAGCFSFYPIKHLTTGEGGMFLTRHPDVAEAVAQLRAFGVDRSHGARKVPGLYDVTMAGLNYRMSEMQAALGRSQLTRIQENLERRRANFERLKASLAGRPGTRVLDATAPDAANSHYCLGLILEQGLAARRGEAIELLKADGIGTSIYYPHPVPRLTYYREKYADPPEHWPEATCISDHSLALPVGPHLGSDEIDRIGRSVNRVLDELAR